MYAITPKERLQQYAKHVFGNYKEMELHCGLVNGAIGTATELSMKNLVKVLESCPDINPDWLILGTGRMLRSDEVIKPATVSPAAVKQPADIQTLTVSDPTQPYKGKIKDGMITVPSGLLAALQQQLENKDAQIATLLQLLNSK